MFRKACLPDIRYKDTKNGKSLDRIYKKVSIKYRNKKRAFLFLLASNFCYLKINLSFYL